MLYQFHSNVKSSHNTESLLHDRLIRIFLEETAYVNWRKIIAFSKNWNSVAHGVFKRMADLEIEEKEQNSVAINIKRAREKLILLHTELSLYDEILNDFRNAISSEYDYLFAKHQIYLRKPFFDHISQLIFAAW